MSNMSELHIEMVNSGSLPTWICVECKDYVGGENRRCWFCGIDQEFSGWLWQVDWKLQDSDISRADLPYHLHQWWDMWDANVDPGDAFIAAMILAPSETKPWPEHAVYHGLKSVTI